MPKSKDRQSIRSLKELDRLIPRDRLLPSRAVQKPSSAEPVPVPPETPQNEHDLFHQAMHDVKPLRQRPLPKNQPTTDAPQAAGTSDHIQGIEALTALVRDGKNFIVEYTSEYIEGRGYRVPREITRQLHQGRFAMQDHLDLHGHTKASAREALECFIKDALRNGKHAVLIIHGRGRSSPVRPVLKTMVQNWLQRGPFRKHLVAYASARPCDGGTGATYVLLRHRPITKRFRKKRNFS